MHLKGRQKMTGEFETQLQIIRRKLHQMPELGFQEIETKAFIASYLRDLGLDVYDDGSGVIATLEAGGGNRAIAFRADMDALPITETSTHHYISQQPGKMHACGHDGHMTMLLGAAKLLKTDPDFNGKIIFIFQPNEENGLGAKAMLSEGLFDEFKVDEIYAIHNLPNKPLGEISTKVGQICASESLFEITITGQGGHAAMPHLGADAITVGAEMITSLQTIASRKMPPSSSVVVSVTEFLTDGMRNVLAGKAVIKGDVRCRLPEHRHMVEQYMRQIVSGIAAAHHVEAHTSFHTEFVEVINAKAPVEAVVRAAQSMGLTAIDDCDAMNFSEDFAHFSNEVPGCFFLMGNGLDGPHAKPLHASDYDFNDDLLPIGAAFWAELAKQQLPNTNDEESRKDE